MGNPKDVRPFEMNRHEAETVYQAVMIQALRRGHRSPRRQQGLELANRLWLWMTEQWGDPSLYVEEKDDTHAS